MKNTLILLFLFLSFPAYSKAVKLGRMGEVNIGLNEKTILGTHSKEKPKCVRDKDCAKGFKCTQNNTCEDACRTLIFTSAQTCFEGVVSDCLRGSACNCTVPLVADGAGNCFNPCTTNSCGASVPVCIQNGANYACQCTSGSCSNGKKCNNSGQCETCCSVVANSFCTGCALTCNSGYHLVANACVSDCVVPANGSCNSSGQVVCDSGYQLSGTDCVTPPCVSTQVYSANPTMGTTCTGRSTCYSGGGSRQCYYFACYRPAIPCTDDFTTTTHPGNCKAGYTSDTNYCTDEDCASC